MSRRKYQGKHEVNIPVTEIVMEFAAWADEIEQEIARELLKETRKNAQTAFGDVSGKLRLAIKRKPSRFDKGVLIVGAFAPHAHLVEFGHDMEVHGAVVANHVPAHSFLATAGDAVQARLREIATGVAMPTIEVKS